MRLVTICESTDQILSEYKVASSHSSCLTARYINQMQETFVTSSTRKAFVSLSRECKISRLISISQRLCTFSKICQHVFPYRDYNLLDSMYQSRFVNGDYFFVIGEKIVCATSCLAFQLLVTHRRLVLQVL